MLRDTIETRIVRLLERARAANAGAFANVPSAAALALVVEQRIDASIERLVVEAPMRGPVGARPVLAERWPLCVSAAKPDSAEDSALFLLWQLESGRIDTPNDKATVGALVTEAHALINAIEHQVTEDRCRAAMAIDAGHPHHSLVGGMRDMPKDGLRKRGAPGQLVVENGRVEILCPGHGTAQLRLPLACLNESILETLREWRGTKGLRHWAALQRLLSIEGQRKGRVTWRLAEHLEALGYAQSTRRDQSVRDAVVAEVELLTKMELAVYDRAGKLRLRQALLTPITKAERQIEGTDTWAIEGMSLEVHPLIYDGVRDPKTGKIGRNWFPQIAELAKLDDTEFPYAIALGLILPVRWRWALGEGRDHCALSGGNLLSAAGIEYDRRRAVTAWRSLRRSLDELQRRGALDRYVWNGEPETLGATCRLYPPAWTIDRVVHKLLPLEAQPAEVATTGKALREWRQARGWTQAEAAEKLGIGIATMKRAEATLDGPVSGGVIKRLKDLAEAEEAAKRAAKLPRFTIPI